MSVQPSMGSEMRFWYFATVEEHRKCPTSSGIATNVCAGHVPIFAQEVHEQQAGLDIGLLLFSVNVCLDMMLAHFKLLLRA